MEHVFKADREGLTFIGDFAGLYEAEADPWHQSQAGDQRYADYYEKSRRHTARMLHAHVVPEMPVVCLEVGCGHGHSTRYYREMCGGTWVGYDIASAAVLRARELHESVANLAFEHGDILAPPPEGAEIGKVDVVLWGEIFWYLLHEIEVAVEHTSELIRPGGLFVMNQGFLLGEQRYGAEIAQGWHGALELLLHFFRGFDLIFATYDASGTRVLNQGLAIFRKQDA